MRTPETTEIQDIPRRYLNRSQDREDRNSATYPAKGRGAGLTRYLRMTSSVLILILFILLQLVSSFCNLQTGFTSAEMLGTSEWKPFSKRTVAMRESWFIAIAGQIGIRLWVVSKVCSTKKPTHNTILPLPLQRVLPGRVEVRKRQRR